MPYNRLLDPKRFFFSVLLLAFFIGISPAFAQESPDHVAGEVLVRVDDRLTPFEVEDLAHEYDAQVKDRVGSFGLYLFTFDESIPVTDIILQLQTDHRVQYAEPNGIYNTNGLGNLNPEFDPANGEKVIVAILDTGMDLNHAALSNNLFVNTGEIAGDGIDNDNNGYVDDVHGYDFWDNDGTPQGAAGNGAHGTQVASRVLDGAQGANVEIMSLKVGPGPGLSLSAIINAIDYAANNGAHIINMSFGGTTPSFALQEALDFAADRGVILVAAAGNGGSQTMHYPAAYDNVISVAASDASGRKASFSSFGTWVDVMAHGQNVEVANFGGGTAIVNGTSFSAPYIAGVLAMLKSYDPSLTQAQAFDRMVSLAKDPNALNGGFANLLGKGYIDDAVAQALQEAFAPEPEDPADPPVEDPNPGVKAGEIEAVKAQLEVAKLRVTALETELVAKENVLANATFVLESMNANLDEAIDNFAEARHNARNSYKAFRQAIYKRNYTLLWQSYRKYISDLQKYYLALSRLRTADQQKRQAEVFARQARDSRDRTAESLDSAKAEVQRLEQRLSDLQGGSAQAAAARFQASQFIRQQAAQKELLQANPFAGLGVKTVPHLAGVEEELNQQ